jgi:hypothetical protein
MTRQNNGLCHQSQLHALPESNKETNALTSATHMSITFFIFFIYENTTFPLGLNNYYVENYCEMTNKPLQSSFDNYLFLGQ